MLQPICTLINRLIYAVSICEVELMDVTRLAAPFLPFFLVASIDVCSVSLNVRIVNRTFLSSPSPLPLSLSPSLLSWPPPLPRRHSLRHLHKHASSINMSTWYLPAKQRNWRYKRGWSWCFRPHWDLSFFLLFLCIFVIILFGDLLCVCQCVC